MCASERERERGGGEREKRNERSVSKFEPNGHKIKWITFTMGLLLQKKTGGKIQQKIIFHVCAKLKIGRLWMFEEFP